MDSYSRLNAEQTAQSTRANYKLGRNELHQAGSLMILNMAPIYGL